jgi:hypothetical protein
MRCIRLAFRPSVQLALWAVNVAFLVISGPVICGQEPARGSRGSASSSPYPRLPGAVSTAPEGLEMNAPFDIKRFFRTLPPSQNAAPLYLDALFEFGQEMAVCFPPGPDTERRRQAADGRSRRYSALLESLRKDPKAVPPAAIDDVIKLYDAGFRKLAAAQRIDRCVFEAGLGVAALYPHVQVARQVARVAALKVRRAVERRDLDAAISNVEPVLRLARDLQPRGAVINELVVSAVNNYVCVEIVSTILASPALRVGHCDQLLRVFANHEAKSMDGYGESLRMGYLMTRVTIRDLAKHPGAVAEQMGLKSGESVVNAIAASILGGVNPVGFRPFPADADAQLAQTSSAKMTIKVRELGRYYGALLALDGIPYADRIAKATAIALPDGDDVLSRLVTLMTPPVEPFVRAISRATASVRATECMIAVRRWQLGHTGMPRDLATAIKGSTLKAVPIDPYDGKSMRLALIDGQPVVYSVGRDGKDDNARIDSDRDQRPAGDLVYRLPAPTAAR